MQFFSVILLLMSMMSILINVKSVSKKTIIVWNVYKATASIKFDTFCHYFWHICSIVPSAILDQWRGKYRVVFPGWNSKFLISEVKEGNQQQGKSLAFPLQIPPSCCHHLYLKSAPANGNIM